MKYKSLILFLSFIISSGAHAEGPLEWVCKTPLHENYSAEYPESQELCQLMDMQSTPPHLIKEMEKMYAVKLGIGYPSPAFAELHMGCGTSCSVTSFYNLSTQQLSDGFDDVLAIDVQRKLVVSMGNKGVVLNAMFNPSNEGEVLLLNYDELSSAEDLINSTYDNTVCFVGEYLYISYDDKKGESHNKKIHLVQAEPHTLTDQTKI